MNKKRKILTLTLGDDPYIHSRSVLFDEDEDLIEDKNKKQFITSKDTSLAVIFDDGSKLTLFAPKGYKFDGATIPFGIGKGNMKLQIPALFHDLCCDNKYLVDYDRKLADDIFKRALIECGVNKFIAEIMYLNVEMFQKLFCDWEKPE